MTGEKHTYGTRRRDHTDANYTETPNHSGLPGDYELQQYAETEPTAKFVSRCKIVCPFSAPADPGYGVVGNNCSTFAATVWAQYTGERLLDGVLDTPKNLCAAIEEIN